MPNKYIRKTSRASYSKEDLKVAIERVERNELSNLAASKMYGIPTSTLNDRVRKRTGLKSETLGRPPAISIEMEANLASCLRTLEKWGWGLSKEEVLDLTAEFVRKNKLKTPFKDGKPGHDWFSAFRKRHNLSIKKAQPVEYLRKKMTDPFVIYEYFQKLENVLRELNLNDDPNKIWNLDETSVSLDPTKTKVVGAVGKPCTRTTAGTGKENITVLTTVNAAGKKLTPLIVYKGKYVYDEWMAEQREEFDFDISYAASKRGWLETDIFYNYMSKIVIPGIGVKSPALLIYDGHVTHVDTKVIELAVENNLTILKLPAHTSHLLQPLDLAVFKSLKVNWDKRLVKHQRQNIGVKLRKKDFAAMFAETWHQTSPTVIQNGFKKGGIYPFDRFAVPKEKFDPAALERWKIHKTKINDVKPLKQLCLEILKKVMFPTVQCTNERKSEMQVQEIQKTSFEELLLQKLTYRPQSTGRVTLKRVAQGAEVITRTFLENNKKEQKEALTRKPRQVKSKKNLPPKTSVHVSGPEIQGPSNKVEEDTTKERENIKTVNSRKQKGVGKRSREVKTVKKEKDQQAEGYNNLQTLYTEHENKDGVTMNILDSEIDFLLRENDQQQADLFTHATTMDIFDELGFTHLEKDEIKENSHTGFINILDERTGLLRIEKNQQYDNKYTSITDNFDGITSLSLEKKQESKDTTLHGFETTHEEEEKLMKILDDTTGCLHTILHKKPSKPSKEKVIQEDKENKCTNVKHKYKNTKENIKPNIKRKKGKKQSKLQATTKTKIKRRRSTSSTTTEEVDMSAHSDSDINDIISIESDDEDTIKTKMAKKEAEIFAEIAFIDKKDASAYDLGDTILARYYTKKNWKYYVGTVMNIKSNEPHNKYGISYYKTIRRNNNLKFVKPKRCDEDYISLNLIVKQIDLIQIKENPDEFILNDDEDNVYFL